MISSLTSSRFMCAHHRTIIRNAGTINSHHSRSSVGPVDFKYAAMAIATSRHSTYPNLMNLVDDANLHGRHDNMGVRRAVTIENRDGNRTGCHTSSRRGRRGIAAHCAGEHDQAVGLLAWKRPPTARRRWRNSRSFDAHVIVTDLNMPRMNGQELLQRLKEEGDAPPAIVQTAFGSLETAVNDGARSGRLLVPGKAGAIAGAAAVARARRGAGESGGACRAAGAPVEQSGVLGEMVGASPKMREVFA